MFIAYIVGSLLREVGLTPTFAPMHKVDVRLEGVDSLLFPEVSRLAQTLGACDREAEFEFGLELLIRAIATLPEAPQALQAFSEEHGTRG